MGRLQSVSEPGLGLQIPGGAGGAQVKRKMAEDSAKGTTSSKATATPTTAREQLEQLAAELREKQALVKEATKNVKCVWCKGNERAKERAVGRALACVST
eukprot:1159168-Pelagomonas_calceolata.AAC.2